MGRGREGEGLKLVKGRDFRSTHIFTGYTGHKKGVLILEMVFILEGVFIFFNFPSEGCSFWRECLL